MNAATPDEAVTAHDVRTAQFTLVKRGGYDTQEVDAFLDQVAETLDVIAETRYRAPTRPPVEVAEAPAVAPAPAPAPAPVEAAPRLHDPDGAAQRLLAAAQRTSDALTAEARSYAEAQRAEADAYAATTRADADAHAERVTATAEVQAATIRETAADEARRVAEATRTSLLDEIERLESDRDRLMGDTEKIRRTFAADRMRLLDIVDGLRRQIDDAGADLAAAEEAPAGHGAEPQEAPAPGVPDTVDAASPEVVEAEIVEPEPEPEPEAPAPVEAEALFEDAEPAPETAAARPDGARGQTIFDIESDPTWRDDDGPPTEAVPVISDRGDRFFDELRAADDGGLGPLDEDTDAALTAFFESDDDDDESWRRRFGSRN